MARIVLSTQIFAMRGPTWQRNIPPGVSRAHRSSFLKLAVPRSTDTSEPTRLLAAPTQHALHTSLAGTPPLLIQNLVYLPQLHTVASRPLTHQPHQDLLPWQTPDSLNDFIQSPWFCVQVSRTCFPNPHCLPLKVTANYRAHKCLLRSSQTALFKAISDTEYEFVPKASVLYGQWCIDVRHQIQP